MIIRALQPAEQEAVARLFHAVWHETQGPLQDPRVAAFRNLEFFAGRVRERAPRTLVAHEGNQLAGFACWSGSRFNSLFVGREFRRHGTGAALLAAAEAEMEKSAPHPFNLTCICGNEAARRFYERHGWHVAREEQLSTDIGGGTADVQAWVMEK